MALVTHLSFNDEGTGNMDTLLTLATDERAARIALAVITDPTDATTGHLLAVHGAVSTVTILTDDALVPGLDNVESQLWRKRLTPRVEPRLIQEALDFTEHGGFKTLIPGDGNYPGSLHDLGDGAPYVLWVEGEESLLAMPESDRFTITGARAATSYGVQVANEISADLASDGKVIVAGGAYGIDGEVHRSALAVAGHTIAVMAGGIDRPYPAGHRDLLERVSDVGLLVSEQPPGAPPTRARFMARARIEAALSGSTTIVEAGSRSGSLLVAQQAHSLGRSVGAVPGPVTSATSYGPHRLIAQGIASVVTNANDVRAFSEKQPSSGSMPQLSAEAFRMERYSARARAAHSAHRDL